MRLKSPETGEFPAQMASNAENVSIWWRHHDPMSNTSAALHAALSCASTPTRPQLLTSILTHSDHVFLGLPEFLLQGIGTFVIDLVQDVVHCKWWYHLSRGQRRTYVVSSVLSFSTFRWRHNEHGDVSNHQPHDCLLKRLFRRRSKKTSKLRITGLCEGNSPGTGEFPAQRASNAEKISNWWRHHEQWSWGCFASVFGATDPSDHGTVIKHSTYTLVAVTPR